MTQKATAAEGTTPVVTKHVTDLSIGDVINAPGFEGPRTIRRAAKVNKGPQKGKFELHLADENGQVDIADFGSDENVTVVGHENGKKKWTGQSPWAWTTRRAQRWKTARGLITSRLSVF